MTAPKATNAATMAAAILAGGRARRLGGGHKGLVEVGGRAIVARQLAALKPYVDDCFIVANDAAAYAAFGVPVVADVHPGSGPLAGIEAAFAASDAAHLLVFACDLPFITPAPFVAAAADAAVIVARAGEVVQPLHARYSRAVLPRLQAQLAANQLRLFELVNACDPRYIDVAAPAIFNVNTREDLARAEELTATCRL